MLATSIISSLSRSSTPLLLSSSLSSLSPLAPITSRLSPLSSVLNHSFKRTFYLSPFKYKPPPSSSYSSSLLSPLSSPLRTSIPTTRTTLLPSSLPRTTLSSRPSSLSPSLSPLSPLSLSSIRSFHASTPRYGVHAFRLVHFVAPIIMRQVKAWIGTPSTNVYFKRRLFIVVSIILGIPVVYIATHLETTPYTDRVRFVALTSDDENKLGEMAFSQLMEEHETSFIPEHHHFVTHVVDVATRIIEASDRSDIKWEVRLIDSPITNAFAIPGGKIFVFSGLLNVTQNDDGLAFILGHEVAHVLARHGAEQMTVGRLMLGVSVMLSALFGDNIGSFVLARVISLLTELRYSRNMEREADYIGLLLMHKAKFDIDEAPRVWERMMKISGEGETNSSFLSTHPSHGDRISDLKVWVEEIKRGRKVAVDN